MAAYILDTTDGILMDRVNCECGARVVAGDAR